MQNNANHRHPAQPVQAPPALAKNVLARIQQAEQATQKSEQISTAFASPDWTQRAAVCEQLARAEKTLALPWLQRALADPHPTVRALAVYSLSQHQATELILPLLSDANWQVREAATLALEQENAQTRPDLASEYSDPPASSNAQDVTPPYPVHTTLSGGISAMKSIDQSSSHSFEPYPQAREWQETGPFAENRSPGQQNGKITRQAKRVPRFLGLAAAILVCAVLIGSMALVFEAIKGGGSPTPGTGATQHKATPTASPMPTIPPECQDTQDQAEALLCAQHRETTLQITKNFSGHSVTFVRAYADVSRFLLIYTTTDSPQSDVISFMSVTVQPNIKLSGGSSVAYENPSTHEWYYVVSFSTSTIPAGTKTLHIKSIVDAFSGASTPLQFTTPFHSQPFNAAQRTVTINQTVTSKGIALTLKHVDFTAIGTTFFFQASQTPQMTLYMKSLTINGQQVASSKNNVSSRDVLTIPIDVPLADHPGTWTLQMMEGIENNQTDWVAWTFHFTIPASTAS